MIAAASGHATMPARAAPQRHMANRHAMVVSGSDSYASLFLLTNQTVNDGVAHSKNPRKCAYHVTFDLDLDLEHTLDAR